MKKRIIPSILLRGGTQACLSQGFVPWRTVGTLAQSLRLHVQRSADELLIINLDQASSTKFVLPERILCLVRKEVDIPISYAGGIRTADDASLCINSGFDKVYLTAAFLDKAESLRAIAEMIGSQSVGVSLPYHREEPHGCAQVWDYRSRLRTRCSLQEAMRSAIELGAGELLLYEMSRDGSLSGLDPFLIEDLAEMKPAVPILVAGGAGQPEHIVEALESPWIQGVVAGSIFALTAATPTTIRHLCEQRAIPIRRCSSSLKR